MRKQLLFLELNEINFDHLAFYTERGALPRLSELIKAHGVNETTSEIAYEELEPWIQWVTGHTGLSLEEHGVFRLGDIVQKDHAQIWEVLEQQGFTVGAVCPMNAKNRCGNSAFFIPDPWTESRVSARPLLARLYRSLVQGVNDNAQSRLKMRSIVWLVAGAIRYAQFKNYRGYAELIHSAVSKSPWSRAMFLDLLLSDVFVKETARTRPDFASLFLNAGAHIQHHYLFNSAAYQGALRNPDWYVPPESDPVLDVYRLYDRIVGQVRTAFPNARLMIATGLHQDPHSKLTYYWRLKDHVSFLRRHSVPFRRIEPRMSRDFLVVCEGVEAAQEAERVLRSAKAVDGMPLFEIDNRGSELFVMLTYPNDIGDDFAYTVCDRYFKGLREDVAFVAIKNGQHNGRGYFVDSGMVADDGPQVFALRELPTRICDAMGAVWAPAMTQKGMRQRRTVSSV